MSSAALGMIRCLLRAPAPIGLGPVAGQFVYGHLLALIDVARRATKPAGYRRDDDDA